MGSRELMKNTGKCNIEGLSRNHCCCGKTGNICVCVCVCLYILILVIRRAQRMRRIILSYAVCLILLDVQLKSGPLTKS